MSFPSLRKRIPSQSVTGMGPGMAGTPTVPAPAPTTRFAQPTGALSRIFGGLFGSGNPRDNLSAEVDQNSGPRVQSLFHYHEGDLFTPGTGNYVFEYPFELPVLTIWGNAFLRTPNTFNPRQPSQLNANPNVVTNGIGGLVAGGIAFQPLESDGQ